VHEDGLIVEPSIDRYAELLGVDEWTAEEVLEDVFDSLEAKGVVTYLHDGYYLVEVLDEIEAEEAEAERERQQYLDDIAAEWNRAKGWR